MATREWMVVEGGEELRTRLLALAKGIDVDLAEEAMLEAADPMRQRALEAAPRRTGLLQSQIGLGAAAQEPGAATVGIHIGKKAFYWRFVEFGTRFLTARPFVRPAYDAEKDATVTRFGNRLRQELDQYVEEGGGW
jgi:HK97 gp10 family phage protein